MSMHPPAPRRSGMIIPVVIFCLVVMAILGVVLISNATSQYMQTAKVATSLKVRETLLAGFEEAQALAYDRLNRPPAPTAGAQMPPWHTELLAAIGTGVPDPKAVLVKHDLKPDLARTKKIASRLACEITSASVELFAFKRLSVDSRGLFEDGKIYYRDPDGQLDAGGPAGKLEPVKEFIGSLRVRITVRCENTRTTLSRVSDVKIVNVDPVAREFGLFSFLSSQTEQTPELEDFYRTDLRQGGIVRMFMHGVGRIFVRGPFLVDTVGFPNGNGGKRPPRRSSFSPPQENEWWGWSIVPSTHDGIMTRAGVAVVNFAMPPMRPDKTSDWCAVSGLVTQRFGSSWAEWFDGDPGFYILNGQTWYCESTDTDRNVFSIWGDPAGGMMEPFRGSLVTYDGNRTRTVKNPTEVTYQGNTIPKPPDEDLRWVIEPEGQLYGQYNVVRYTGDSYALGAYEEYDVTRSQSVIGKLGIHWEKKYEQGWWNQFLMDLLTGGTIWGSLSIIPALLIPRSIAESVSITLASWVGFDISHKNTLTELANITPDKLANSLPPQYRPPARTLTRRYRRLNDLLARVGQNPVLLDGVFGFEDMSSERPISYRGRGVFYSEQASSPSITAPVTPAGAGDTRSYLVIHHEGPIKDAHRGGAMLNMRAGTGAARIVNAAVYATQGVKPAGNLKLNGLYTCGFLNKKQIPENSSLEVYYRPSPVTGVITAISPRTAVFVEK